MKAIQNSFYLLFFCSIVDAFAQHTYTINLMWINKQLTHDQPFLYPAQNIEELREKFLRPIFNWARYNPNACLHIWFDSAMTTDKALDNTWSSLQEYVEQNSICTTIELLDIRELPLVKQHPEIFSDKIPVYFRIDLLRAIAAVHMISTKETEYFVYSDLDVEALPEQELFDPETIRMLGKYGIVMAYHQEHGFENNFQIICNKNPRLLAAMSWALIEVNIQRAYNALQGNFYDYTTNKQISLPEPIVYASYNSMFDYFYSRCGWGTLRIYGEIFDPNKHGLHAFGTDTIKYDLLLTDSTLSQKGDTWSWVPTKQVSYPPSHFDN